MYTIDFQKPIHVHFIGIGGISMSGLAEILLNRHFTVTGSDMQASDMTKHLEETGAKVVIGQKAENITDDIDLVVYTAAIHESNEEFAAARKIVLSEPPVDTVTDEIFEVPAGCCAFAVEYLPGQYDQREDFAEQAIQLITQKERPMVASAKIYILEGNLTEAELAKIKSYCINPVLSLIHI